MAAAVLSVMVIVTGALLVAKKLFSSSPSK
jgi:hypothetical protein